MEAIKPIVSAYVGTANTVNAASTSSVNQTASNTGSNSTNTLSNGDTVQFSPAAIEVAKYASLARRIQDHVSPDKIAALKQAVATGNYPPPLAVDGMLSLVGSGLINQQSSDTEASDT